MIQEKIVCPDCESKNVELLNSAETFDGTVYRAKCNDCGCEFSDEL